MSGARPILTATFCLLALCCTPVVQQPKSVLGVTGAAQALERVTTEPVDERNPAISPDGRVLLFQSIAREGLIEKRTLVAVDPNTRAQRTLFTSDKSHSRDPAWIAGGTSYLYVSNSPGSASIVRALTAAPNAAISVVAAGEIAPAPAHPSISPDGQRVAFETAGKIAVIGLDGSRLTLLGEGVSPAWSPDGQLVAFCRTVGTGRHLFVANPDTGTGLIQLTSGEYDHCAPSWSPDGQFIVFSTNRARAETGEASSWSTVRNLYIINRDGTTLTELTAGSAIADEPNWGTDGWIYFTSNQEGDFDIWRLLPTGRYAGLRPYQAPADPAATAAPPTAAPPAPPPPSEPAPSALPADPAPPPPPAPSTGGCTKDTDCKGDRICEKGTCVSPE